jgi:hypothetical protein
VRSSTVVPPDPANLILHVQYIISNSGDAFSTISDVASAKDYRSHSLTSIAYLVNLFHCTFFSNLGYCIA